MTIPLWSKARALLIVRELGTHGNPETPAGMQKAAAQLRRLGTAGTWAVTRAIRHASFEGTRAAAAEMAAILNRPEFVQALGDAMHDQAYFVRWAAVGSLKQMGAAARPALPKLIAGLGDADPLVRMLSADAIAAAGANNPEALQALAQAGADPDARVRANAIVALRQLAIDDPLTASTLCAALADVDMHVRAVAVVGLRTLAAHDPQVIAKIREAVGPEPRYGDVQLGLASVLGRP